MGPISFGVLWCLWSFPPLRSKKGTCSSTKCFHVKLISNQSIWNDNRQYRIDGRWSGINTQKHYQTHKGHHTISVQPTITKYVKWYGCLWGTTDLRLGVQVFIIHIHSQYYEQWNKHTKNSSPKLNFSRNMAASACNDIRMIRFMCHMHTMFQKRIFTKWPFPGAVESV